MASRPGKIGLALAGGGAEGAIYEIGALRALHEAVDGLDLNDLEVYVGVSAGSFVASFLANGWTAPEMSRALEHQGSRQPFAPEVFYRPALGEFLRRGGSTPRLLLQSLREFAGEFPDRNLLESLTRMTEALPVALFDNEPIRAYLARLFASQGRTDDFRLLQRRLFVIAADLDSGEPVRLGDAGFEHVPISRAVQASSALPGLYPPVEIDGRQYVDGVLLKTLHASVALEAGVELLLCINPIVPVDTRNAVEAGVLSRNTLTERGLPAVLAQTFRTMIHSRMSVGFSRYAPEYPDTDVLLLEPKRDDYRMFFTNIFSFAARRAVCRHAYVNTRRELRERADEIEPTLRRHGLGLRRDVLADDGREDWESVPGPPESTAGASVASRLDEALARLEAMLDGAEPRLDAPAPREGRS